MSLLATSPAAWAVATARCQLRLAITSTPAPAASATSEATQCTHAGPMPTGSTRTSDDAQASASMAPSATGRHLPCEASPERADAVMAPRCRDGLIEAQAAAVNSL